MNIIISAPNGSLIAQGYNPDAIQIYKSMGGGRYNPTQKVWEFPFSRLSELTTNLKSGNVSFFIEETLLEKLEQEKIDKDNRYKEISKKIEDLEKIFCVSFYEHQKETIHSLLAHQKFGIFSEMGTGKTIAVLAVVKILEKQALIVCPKSVIPVWRSEAKKIGLVEGRNFIIHTYESVQKRKMIVGESILILDESHKIKNRKANRTAHCVALAQTAQRVYLLTGTPGANRPEDLWQQGAILDSDLFGSYYNFLKRFCILGNRFSAWAITGYQNLAGMSNLLSKVSIRHKKEDCLDLPEKIFSSQYFDFEPEQKKMYQEIKNELETQLTTGEIVSVSNALSQLMRLIQISSHPKTLDQNYSESTEKIEFLKEFVSEDFENSHLIIFASFHVTVDIISAALSNHSVKIIDGRTSLDERTQILQWFQQAPCENGKKKILVGNPATMGEGLNLQIASTVIFFDRTYNLTHYLQAQDRVHRIGQTKKVNIINLLYDNSIETRILDILQYKKDLQRMTLAEIKQLLLN